MSKNLVSVKRVISKLYRDLRLTDSRYVSDMIEWSGEAMEFIGTFPSLHQKQVPLEVTNHQARIPGDLAQIEMVAVFDSTCKTLTPLRYNSKSFPQRIHAANSPNRRSQHKNGYIVNYNYIETDIEEGKLALAYLAYPVDCDGFPMVVDDAPYQEALKWWIVTRMIEGGWKHPAGLGYADAESRWLKYCSQARQKLKMPNIAEYQHFLENWVNLVPDYQRYDKFFDSDYEPPADVVTAEGIINKGVDQLTQI